MLQKDAKGRLKKLRKKALNVNHSSSFSGLTRKSDLDELHSLLSSSESCSGVDSGNLDDVSLPRIGFKNNVEHDFGWSCSLSDHRDLLLNLLVRDVVTGNAPSSTGGKNLGSKRKRSDHDDDGRKAPIILQPNAMPPIPNWVNVHNPISITHAVILIAEIDYSTSSQEIKMTTTASDTTVSTFLHNCNNRSVVNIRSMVFQGNQPKEISEVLFRMERKVASRAHGSEENQKKGDDNQQLMGSLFYNRLIPLCVSNNVMRKEDYPVLCTMTSTIDDDLAIKLLDNDQCCVKSFVRYITEHIHIFTGKEENDPVADSGYVSAILSYTSATENLPNAFTPAIFAIDCEMVLTSEGLELARATLIRYNPKSEDDMDGHTVEFDELVKPLNPIQDYLTKYSGIKAIDLKGISTRLEDIQHRMLTVVRKEDIIVGHSLENDFRALKFCHSKVVDTSILFRGQDKRKHSLKHLSQVLLRRKIQDNHCGHCSKEDALASLALANCRGKNGPEFRLKSRNENQIYVLQALEDLATEYKGNSTFSIATDPKPFVVVGPDEWIKHVTTKRCHALSCNSIYDSNAKSIISYVNSSSRKPSVIVSKLICKSHGEFYRMLDDVKEKTPRSTVILAVIQKNISRVKDLYNLRKTRKNPKSSLSWVAPDEDDYQKLFDEAKFCEVFWICP